MTDKAVRELVKLPRLNRITLGTTTPTDDTINALLSRGGWRGFILNYTQATPACLPAILKNTDLEELGLRGIPLRDDDVRRFAGLRKLLFLGICGRHIKNDSVRLLEPLPMLRTLELWECEQVDDGVFDHLGRLKNLTDLRLGANGKITDAGLAKVKNLPKLTLLELIEMKSITADGVRKLRAELPKLKVEWDGDLKEKPASKELVPPDFQRRLAEWVLRQDGGFVALESWQKISRLENLAADDMRFRQFSFRLPNPTALTPQVAAWLQALPLDTAVSIELASAHWKDDGLARFASEMREVRNLTYLAMGSPSTVTDEGLKQLFEIRNLKGIGLFDLKISDNGVRQLGGLAHLERIQLSELPVTDDTVGALLARGTCREFSAFSCTQATPLCLPAILKNAELEGLYLRGVPLTEDDLRKVTGLKKLRWLGVGSSIIPNGAFRHLKDLPALFNLSLHSCEKIDDGVFDQLGKLTNLTLLNLIDVNVTDAGLERVKSLPKLEGLRLTATRVTAEGVARLRAAEGRRTGS